jgi:uncharacterized protein
MTAHRLQVFRLNAREMLRRPGLAKHIELSLAPGELGIDDDRLTGDIGVDLDAVSTIDGITVTGTVTMPWRAGCRRCLAEVTGTTAIAIDEVYQDVDDFRSGRDDDAFEIVGDQVDLAPAIREHLLLELPDDPLCRDDCRGICPVCGTDLNTGTCDCDTTVRDDRWAALDALRLDDD